MEVDRISYIFGSSSRRRQSSQELGKEKRFSTETPKICHDRSNSAPHNTRKSIQQANRAKSVCNVLCDKSKFYCPSCHSLFIEPRVLPCLHTVCVRCLQKLEVTDSTSRTIGSEGSLSDAEHTLEKFSSYDGSSNTLKSSSTKVKREIACPVCGSWSKLPSGGVSNFPLNYLLQHKLVLASLNANATRLLLCDLCTANVPAISRCTECALSFCTDCTEEHLRQRSYAQHEVLTIEEAKKRGITSIRRQIMCTTHQNQELSLFCFTCSKILCQECVTISHKDHTCSAASEAAKSFISNLRKAVDKASLAAEQSAITLTHLQAAYNTIETQCDHVQAQVDQFIHNYVKAIENHKKRLTEQIQQARQEKLNSLEIHRKQLQKQVRSARDVAAFIDELLNEGTDVEILSFAQPVLKTLETCTVLQKTSTDLKTFDSLQFLPNETAIDREDVYPLYGVITTQIVSPKNCVINTEGLSNVRIGKKIEIILETRDKTNTCLNRGGEPVISEIVYRDLTGTTKTTQIPVNDLRNGKYYISFVPETLGKLLLYVYVRGHPIKNNPFPITVRALKPHQGTYHCCSFCSSNGSKDATCGCGGKMPGGYKGCGHGHEGHPGKRHWSCCGSCVEHSECSRNNSNHYQFTL